MKACPVVLRAQHSLLTMPAPAPYSSGPTAFTQPYERGSWRDEPPRYALATPLGARSLYRAGGRVPLVDASIRTLLAHQGHLARRRLQKLA